MRLWKAYTGRYAMRISQWLELIVRLDSYLGGLVCASEWMLSGTIIYSLRGYFNLSTSNAMYQDFWVV